MGRYYVLNEKMERQNNFSSELAVSSLYAPKSVGDQVILGLLTSLATAKRASQVTLIRRNMHISSHLNVH